MPTQNVAISTRVKSRHKGPEAEVRGKGGIEERGAVGSQDT